MFSYSHIPGYAKGFDFCQDGSSRVAFFFSRVLINHIVLHFGENFSHLIILGFGFLET